MGITILPPVVEDIGGALHEEVEEPVEDSEGDIEMDFPLRKRPRLAGGKKSKPRDSRSGIVVPGELVTDDPQWMR